MESSRLNEASPYFARLLDPDKFGEGSAVAEKHKSLKATYESWDAVPFEELPQIKIEDVGRISAVKTVRNLMADFLTILHGGELNRTAIPPLANVANLVVVADRFDALPTVRFYFRNHKLMAALDSKVEKGKTMSEERVRQKLLVGLLLDNASWVWANSARLVMRGWVGREPVENAALWWDLPGSIEDELLFRRDCILETIQSLQSYFLSLYTSGERQCKLGYDSSPQCDVYQLGQMIRFFKRINTVALSGTIISTTDPPEPYDGEILHLIESLRQCPGYQIDKNHHHCGLRDRLRPLLDFLEVALQDVGLCLQCWQNCRQEYAWTRVKRPLIWKYGSAGAGMYQYYKERQAQSHLFKHLDTRDLFMAVDRLWTTGDATRPGLSFSSFTMPRLKGDI